MEPVKNTLADVIAYGSGTEEQYDRSIDGQLQHRS
jgi:hypothetical protein